MGAPRKLHSTRTDSSVSPSAATNTLLTNNAMGSTNPVGATRSPSEMLPGTWARVIRMFITDIKAVLDPEPEGSTRRRLKQLCQKWQIRLDETESGILAARLVAEERQNQATFNRLLEEERQAVEDHRLAQSLSGVRADHHVTRETAGTTPKSAVKSRVALKQEPGTDRKALSQKAPVVRNVHEVLRRRHISAALEALPAPVDLPASLPQKAIGSDRSAEKLEKDQLECCVCFEVVENNSLTLKCTPQPHTYCQSCVVKFFQKAMEDSSNFPPRCCNAPIPLDDCRHHLPDALIQRIELKQEELATPNPTFCSKATCAKFIRTSTITADIATCTSCNTKTCTRCKAPEHDGLCPEDPQTQLTLDLAKAGKWRACSNCKNMIELDTGCFHMRCRCQHEFCYRCGVTWKKCRCPLWDEGYLERTLPAARAGAAAACPAPVRDPPADHRVHRLRRVVNRRCQVCDAAYLDFAMQCEECNRAYCWRCIRARNERYELAPR